MSSSLRRGVLAAAAITFSILPLAACGAGNNAQTLEIKPDNAATTVGDIKVQNAVVITQPDPEAGGPAVVAATLFNTGTSAQTLESVTVDGAGESAELKAAKGKSLSIPAGGSLILGGAENASAVLSVTPEDVKDGNAQEVTFTFSKTGDVSLRAFVVPSESYFTGWGPTEVPAAPEEDTASPTGEATGEPTGEATGEPGGEASGTPTDAASATATESHEASGH
ncbi:DUF461 domain-containing protein [Streptomyces sp. NBC_00287]|uniref:DUF461 domain-containing protein n=1 Tax=Streptomyces sp. NBC_00287 TaxID=2975702 RepID=UPI002E2DEA9F|nr:DUF461 domain-containing protein [Streptomyces sp. NBC_00287]